MEIKSDIEIAQSCEMKNIREIAATAGVDEKYLEMYGNYKAKVDYKLLNETQAQDGKLILVTAITPTPAGEGKTTTSVGLADGLRKLGKHLQPRAFQRVTAKQIDHHPSGDGAQEGSRIADRRQRFAAHHAQKGILSDIIGVKGGLQLAG